MKSMRAKWLVWVMLPIYLLGCAPRSVTTDPQNETQQLIYNILEEVDFPIRFPHWLPDGYSFGSLSLSRNVLGKVDQVWLVFVALSRDRSVTIMLWPPSGQNATQKETVLVGRYQAQYEEQPRQNGEMLRIVDLPMEELRVIISSSHLSREEILHIAESMIRPQA